MNEGAARTRRALLFGLEAVRSGVADASVVSDALATCEGRIAVAFRDVLVERGWSIPTALTDADHAVLVYPLAPPHGGAS